MNTIYTSNQAGTYNPAKPASNDLVSPEDSTIVFVRFDRSNKVHAIQTSGTYEQTLAWYPVGSVHSIEATGRDMGMGFVVGLLGKGEDFDEIAGEIPTKTVPFRVFK